MDSSIVKKVSDLLGEKNRHRRWQITVTALAALVVITTAYILSKPAQTLVKDTYCGIEEHEHTEECYSQVLICGYEDIQVPSSENREDAVRESVPQEAQPTEGEAHQHDETCYIEERELICGQEEGTGHEHTEACKTITENRELTCGQEESDGHSHTDACKTITESLELTCGQEESETHSHTDACYTVNQTEEITCGQEESPGHSHTDACYTVNQTEEITCGQEESTGHQHTDTCYETVRKLVCEKEETETPEADEQTGQTPTEDVGETTVTDGSNEPAEPIEPTEPTIEGEETPHVHTEACYEKVLTCKAVEHTHEEQCYEEVFCGITGHTHGVSCYDEEGNLTCETMEHRHDANCYKEPHCGITVHIHGTDCHDAEGNLICGTEEHVHTEECYITNTYYCTEWVHSHSNDCYDLEGNLLCGSADYQVHSHNEDCYDKNERLICPLEEREEEELHTHTEECFGVRGVLSCGQMEVLRHEHDDTCRIEPSETWSDTISAIAYCGIPAHTHRDICKDAEGNIICGLEEHTHTEECFEEPGYGCTAQIHVHEADCYDAEGNIRCGLGDYVFHTHGPLCYGLNGKLLCNLPEIEPHVHGEECYTRESEEAEPVLICTLPEAEDHEHTDSCRDENGNLICGKLQIEEHEHTEDCIINAGEIEITQICKGTDFIVTATYNKKAANLPEEAQLFAELITEEDNEEYYAERAAQYQEMQGEEEEDTMQALMRIGFTCEGEEVEPEAPVTIKLQLLGEDGMAEGSPVTVIHFSEAGNERLNGTDAEKNSTTFQMNSFSEIALGWKKPVKTVTVDKSFIYEDDAFTVKFHVEGEAVLPTAEEIEEAGKANVADTQTEEIAGNTEEEITAGGEMQDIQEDSAENTESIPEDMIQDTGTEAGETVAEDTAEEPSEDGNQLDSAVTEDGSGVTSDDLEAVVEPVDETEAAYKTALAYAEETNASDAILSLQVLSYRLLYEGVKLDLSDCKVTVEVTPTEALVEFAENNEASVMAIEDDTEAEDSEAENEGDVSLIAVDVREADGGFTVDNIYGALTVSRDTAKTPIMYEADAQGTDNIATVYASSQANPQFTVEFYANIDILATSHTSYKPITVIDTSKQSGQNSATLPTNGGNMKKKNVYVVNEEGAEDYGTVVMQNVEKEIYSAGTYNYVEAPGLVYFNKIAKNKNYVLSEIRVQRKGSTTWEHYSCANGKEWHFTNKSATQQENRDDFILITEGATIRLIYNCQEKEVRNGVNFYDYDVSDGRVYTEGAKEADRGDAKTHDSGDVWYLYTNRQGINSNLTNQTFGFGNSEGTLMTTMGEIPGNRANAVNAAYGSPTFGLVTGLAGGKIQYASNVIAPNLFNDGDASGKTEYSGNLVFRQTGDTYTLTGAEVVMGEGENKEVVSSVYGVDKFKRQRDNWNKTYYFAGNDFYPLDTVPTAGVGGHDLMFGSPESVAVTRNASDKKKFINDKNKGGEWLSMPESDDGQNHNHYFGMHYTVEFDLVEDYRGPLEYLFYGDDDMWVFLEGPGYTGKLICDIGGVHSSVGEYVNLWDYIEQGTAGKYKLSFFYTERGASGSTCWMQFTLPSVSFATTEQDTGKLRIEKQVTGNENTDEEFGFVIHFYRTSGETKEEILAQQTEENALKNDYSYTKYDSTGGVIENDILIWNDSKFTLKAGEYIVISFLPEGSSYAIEEIGPVNVGDKEPGENINWEKDPDDPYSPIISGGMATDTKRKIIGIITKDSTEEIEYNNLYQFVLPETGGSGTTNLYALAGAVGLLFGAGLVYRKKSRERRA